MNPARGRRFHVVALAALLAAALASCGPGASKPFDSDAVPDAYVRPGAALAWPGAARAYWVTPDGDLYNGDWEVRIAPSADGITAAGPRRIAAEDRWLPVLHWTRTSGNVRWDFEALAAPGATRDSGLVVSLTARAVNTGNRPAEARFDVALALPDTVPPFAAFDAPEPSPPLVWGTTGTPGEVHAWSPVPASGGIITQQWHLLPGVSVETRLVLPAYPEPAPELTRWAKVAHARRADDARRYWRDAVAHGAQLVVGDPDVENAVRAAQVVLLECRERRGPAWVPIGGPFHYRDVWLRDGARAVHALTLWGHADEARELAAGLLGLQLSRGPFLSQRGQLDGTGQALWAFEQVAARLGDVAPRSPAAADLARFADAATLSWRWITWQRDLGAIAGWPYATMLPFADPRDNELTTAQLVGNDAWTLAGCRAAERLVRAAGRGPTADSIAATRAAYAADFAAALARTGAPDVPPSWQGTGRDWGNLTVVYPCAVLAANDPRAVALAERVWSRHGGPGLLGYGGPDTLQYYYGADLGTWALLVGRRADADRVLDAMLHWRDATGGAGELFSRAGDFGRNLPPHPSSAAALLTLVRHAIAFDEGDTLRLTLGARESWWRDGRLSGTPTRWGVLDVRFRHESDAASWTWTPVEVWTALTLPPGTRAAQLAAPLVATADPSVVLAPPGTREARVALARP